VQKPVVVSRSWRFAVCLTLLSSEFVTLYGADRQNAGSSQQMWIRQVGDLLREPSGWAALDRHDTAGLAFSPDDQWLALTVAHDEKVGERKWLYNTHLFVISAKSPETGVRQFDLTQTCGKEISWNVRGDAVLVCGVVLHLNDGATCQVNTAPPKLSSFPRTYGPGGAWWLDADHVLRWNGEILDSDCRRTGRWLTGPNSRIGDVAGQRVLLVHSEGTGSQMVCQYSVVDLASHELFSGWPTRKSPCTGQLHLVPGAEALCFSTWEGLGCREWNGGKEIALPKLMRNYSLDQVSSSARIALLRWEAERDPWWYWLLAPLMLLGDYPGGPALPKQEAVLDLRTLKVVFSRKARMQRSSTPYIVDWAYQMAVSGNGGFLAESGGGSVELNQLTP
jgi:hypothetical protein